MQFYDERVDAIILWPTRSLAIDLGAGGDEGLPINSSVYISVRIIYVQNLDYIRYNAVLCASVVALSIVTPSKNTWPNLCVNKMESTLFWLRNLAGFQATCKLMQSVSGFID